jgi:hypothetical protein
MLEELKNNIIKELGRDNVWFYEDYFSDCPHHQYAGSPIRGFLGEGDKKRIIFVSPNPSGKVRNIDGNEPRNSKLELFYTLLNERNFNNEHLTDFTKKRLSKEDAGKFWKQPFDNLLIEKEKKWLKEEFKIVNPEIVVIVGKTNAPKIRKFLIENQLIGENNIKDIHHYSQRGQNLLNHFINDMIGI